MKKFILAILLILSISLATGCASTDDTGSTTDTSTDTSTDDSNQYDDIADVKTAEVGTLFTIKGIVVKHNYTGQTTPYIVGFWIADDTGSTYVYGEDSAKSVEEGNLVILSGEKDYYIPSTDTSSASAIGYEGMSQLKSPEIISNEGGSYDIPSSAIEETTIAELNSIDLTTDITGNLYKVKASYYMDDDQSYTNYYITDLNKVDQMMAYTQSDGKDFAWTADYSEKTIEMIIVISVGKPSTISWRFAPIEIIGEYETTDQEEADYSAYRASLEFSKAYNVETTVNVAINDSLLDGSVVSVSSSSDKVSISQDATNNVVVISPSVDETIEITAKATYEGKVGEYVFEVSLSTSVDIETMTIAEAEAQTIGTIVTVKAVVARLTYKSGFTTQGMFLVDDTGSMFCYNGTASLENLVDVANYYEVIVQGTIDRYIKTESYATEQSYTGDFQLTDVTILSMDTNYHDIPLTAIETTTIEALVNTPTSTNITGNVYRVSAYVEKVENTYYTAYYLYADSTKTVQLSLYSQLSGADFDELLEDLSGQQVDMLIGIQNLNLKSSDSNWRACPIYVFE